MRVWPCQQLSPRPSLLRLSCCQDNVLLPGQCPAARAMSTSAVPSVHHLRSLNNRLRVLCPGLDISAVTSEKQAVKMLKLQVSDHLQSAAPGAFSVGHGSSYLCRGSVITSEGSLCVLPGRCAMRARVVGLTPACPSKATTCERRTIRHISSETCCCAQCTNSGSTISATVS